MKQVIRQYIISTIVLLAIFIVIREVNDNRPFKFEKYSYDNINSEVQKKFPVGTNVDEVIEILVASNIDNIRIIKVDHKCELGHMKEAAYFISFFYNASFLSLNFASSYAILIEIGESREIIKISGYKESFLSNFWW